MIKGLYLLKTDDRVKIYQPQVKFQIIIYVLFLMMAKPKHLLHSLSHFLIGSTLTLKGYDKLHHHIVIGGIILAFGIIILIYFFYTLFKKHLSSRLVLIIHWFEAIAALFTAYIFFKEGATYLPYLFIIAAIGFFISIYMHYRKHKTSKLKITPGKQV